MFDKIFNWISIVGGIVGGFLCDALGGWDVILKALVTLIILDYVTGILKGIYTKTLSSAVGFKGLIRKTLIFVVVATAVVAESVIGNTIPLREIVIIFFVCNEAISLLENASQFIPIPEKLKETLIQLRDSKNGKNEKKEG